MNTQRTKTEDLKPKTGRRFSLFGIRFSILLLTLLVAGRWSPAAATTVSGTFKRPDGTPINGAVEFTLSQPAKTTTPPATYAPVKTTCAILSGAIAGGCTVQGNDTLDPAGTFYRVRVLDLNNLVVVPSANYTISGAAADLGSLPVTATDTLVPPTGSVTGNLNVTGNLTVGGAATFGADPENFSHLRLLGLTADPATVTSGSVFHRSDSNRIRFRAGGLEIFDGTQYLPVSASSLGTIELGANLTVPGLYSATFKRLNDLRLVDPFLWLESGVNAKLNAALTDCGGLECRVLLPSNLPSGWPTDSTWPETAALLDLRGNTSDPRLVGNFRAPFKFIGRKTSDVAGQDVFSAARALLFHDFGGENIGGGPKDQYHAVAADLISSGRGEDQAIRARTTKYGVGDALGIIATGMHYGNCTEAGGECAVGGRFSARTGDVVMTATVSSAVDNGSTMTLNYSSPVNEYSRGLGRLVVNANPAKVHTAGSVSSISSAAPPIVTGSGTTWATAFGTGAHTDLCFSQNDDDAAGFKFVAPVRSVDSNTQLTLDYDPQGADKQWPADNNGSSYRLYKCGEVTVFNIDGGSLTLTKGTTDWAAGDTLEMPLGWAWHGAGINVILVKDLPSFQDWGLAINSAGARAIQQGLVFTGSGGYQFGLSFNNTWAQSHGFFGADTIGIRFQNPPTIALQTATVTGNNILLRAKDTNGTTGDADLMYATNSDKFAFLHSNTPANEIDFFPVQGQVIASIYSTRTYHDLGGTSGTVPGSGLIRVRSGNGGTPILATRNQANAANVNLLTYSTSDRLQLAQSGTPVEFVGGVHSDGGGFKHRRVTTGSVSASSSAAVTVSWTTAFADANYTATCSVVESTAGTNSLRIHHLESTSASSVVVRVVNDDTGAAHTGTVHCSAVHD